VRCRNDREAEIENDSFLNEMKTLLPKIGDFNFKAKDAMEK